MVDAIIWGAVALVIILGLTFWVTKKAYSRKWDEEEE
jgi:FtsZ-interacting cell division protein ZipA